MSLTDTLPPILTARLVSLQVGLPRDHGRADAPDKHDQPWYTGFYKEPVKGPVMARRTNLDGDGQGDLTVHGGPDKAIFAYSIEHYPFWRERLALAELPYGSLGENLSLADVTEELLCIGDVFELGGARLQISQPRQPCWKLARRWRKDDLPKQVIQTGRSGWYFRVLVEGLVEQGQSLRLLERPCPEWTVARVNELRYHRRHDVAAARHLADCPFLSVTWRKHFDERS